MLQIAFLTLLLQSSASIDGIVVKQGTGEPIAGATVQLNLAVTQNPIMPGRDPLPSPLISPDPSRRSTTSDRSGRFEFQNVVPGEYRLVATHSSGGYVPAEYGQRTPTGEGIKFKLAAGQKMSGTVLTMTSTGSISGRIYDAEGEPLGRAQVQVLRPIYRDGHRTLTIVQVVESDDRGEYRLFWLPPGQYYVAAKSDTADLPILPNNTRIPAVHITPPMRFSTFEQASSPVITKRRLKTGEVVEETMVPVYFPGTTEAQSATAVSLQPGAVIAGIDFSVGAGRVVTHHIRGRVIGDTAGQQPPFTQIQLVPQSAPQPSFAISILQTDANGTFDMAGVIPGSYMLIATKLATNAVGRIPIEVGDRDIENLPVVLAPPFTLIGQFLFDGAVRGSTDPNFSQPVVTFTSDGANATTSLISMAPIYFSAAADGSFKWTLFSGDFRATLRFLPENAYVKSFRMGSTDILNDGLHLYSAPEGPLEIVIGLNAGTLEGTVLNARQEPAPNRTVVLVPDIRLRQRSDLYKNVATDSIGHFQFKGITPGTYKLFAWEQVESGAWQDPEFIGPFESRGKLAQVIEGGNESVELVVIP
jgi:Carboxypeptidase regulatory-like domain